MTKCDEELENNENKTSLKWGSDKANIDENSIPDPELNEFDLNVQLIVLSNKKIKMDTENSSINEVDSVKDCPNKTGLLESYFSDTSTSNYIKFKSSNEGSIDNCSFSGYYSDLQNVDTKTEFLDSKLHIVENIAFTSKFEPSPVTSPPEEVLNESKISSRTLLADYDEGKDSLDKLWNMKSLFQDMKTDYNYPRTSSDIKFEEDFKNNYLYSINTKRTEPVNGDIQSPEAEDRVTLDFYKFELEKMQKIVNVLKGQVVNRDEEIAKLNEKVQEYAHWKSELEPSKQASLVQYKAENEAVVAVNFAKLQAQVVENERLTQKLMQMEEQHRSKDDEIRILREKVVENELTSGRFDRDLKSLEIDKQMLKNSIDEMEKTFRQREMQLKLNLDMEYQNQLSNILKEQEQLITLVSDKEHEIEKCKELLKTARYECSQLLESILKLKEVLMKRNQDVKLYKNKVIELESMMIANDKTSELKIARETQSKLRDKIRQLEQRLEMMEESVKVHSKAKEENLYLRAKIEKLEDGGSRDYSQNMIELGNQMMPLSLANLRDQ